MSFWPVVDGKEITIAPGEWWLISSNTAGINLWTGNANSDYQMIKCSGRVDDDPLGSDKAWGNITGLRITPEQAQKLIDVARHMHEPQWRAYIQRIWTELVDEAQRNA